MVVELFYGWLTHSMALLADGWHMASHAGALGLTLFGYWFARYKSHDPRFSFGTGKVFSLTGFASGVGLALVGVAVAGESIHRLVEPQEIDFTLAIWVSVIGLVVNLACAVALGSDETGDGHGHSHGHSHGHDHNFQAAYLHVLADALTSVLAIVALVLGSKSQSLGVDLVWLDPAIGIVGGVIIVKWSVGLCRNSAKVLLDVSPSVELIQGIRTEINKTPGQAVLDLHVWDMGLGRYACMISIGAADPSSIDHYRQQINGLFSFTHLTIEINAIDMNEMSQDDNVPAHDCDHGHSHEHNHDHR